MKTYKQMASELDRLMEDLQSDSLDIDDAVKVYEQAIKLIAQMEIHLEKAENKITKLKANLDSTI